jgi:hypothetical protein
LPAQDLQRPTLKRVALAYDGHPLRVAVEVVVMGIAVDVKVVAA